MSLLNQVATCLLDLPFAPIQNQDANNARTQKIPCQVFQTWETNMFGKRHRNSIQKFRSRNPDLGFYLFQAYERDRYMMQHWSESPISDIYFQSRFGAMRADIFRYCILFDKGGYYFDIGKGLSSQITSLHDASSSALISFEKNPVPSDWPDSNLKFSRNLVLQWGFGFEKKHKILDMQIKRIIQNYPKYLSKKFANPKLAILELTGPLAFTQSVRDFLESSSSIDLTQAGIDFNNTGIFALPGAGSRLLQFPSYGQAVNQSLFLS